MIAVLRRIYRCILDILIPERRAVRRFIRDAVTGLAVRKAVDLGAGTSPYRDAMAQALPGAWLIATDLQFRDTDLVADATRLPFADSSIDFISAFQVLQCTDTDSAMREIHRVLRPGGHCLLVCPFLVAAFAPSDKYRWTMTGLENAVGNAGFSAISMRRIGGFFLALCALLAQSISIPSVGWTVEKANHPAIPMLLKLTWNIATGLPFYLLGQIALAIDSCLPPSRFYIGSMILARKADHD